MKVKSIEVLGEKRYVEVDSLISTIEELGLLNGKLRRGYIQLNDTQWKNIKKTLRGEKPSLVPAKKRGFSKEAVKRFWYGTER